jgi:L-ascorbate metabolism protein UlaG (beta-lactamase superfamily)
LHSAGAGRHGKQQGKQMRQTTLITAAALAGLTACAPLPPTQAKTEGKTTIQWLGQSTTRITTPGGKVIVVDPWITSNPKTPEQYKTLESLGKVDMILVTHGHFDHFTDAPALARLNKVPVHGPAGLMQSVAALGILEPDRMVRFGKGGTVTPPGTDIKITQVHAEHSSELAYKNAAGKEEVHVGGEPAGFIIELENGFKIYHMGDTGLFGDMNLIGSYYKPDVVLIPIGGHFVMSPADAAYATREMIKPKFAIPVHYGTTPQLKGTTAEYISALGQGSAKVFPINPGDKLEF